MSNQVNEFKLSFMTMAKLREVFEEGYEKVMSKQGCHISNETIHGSSSFNVYISPTDFWWVNQGLKGEEEWIAFLSEHQLITEEEEKKYREHGMQFSMTTMTEFNGEGEELHVYSKEMLTTAKEAMFTSFVDDYDTYMGEMWLELEDLI